MILLNQIKVAIRNLRHYRIYGLLNLATLSMAFAAIFLIAIYVHYETTFDTFHKKVSQIYRLTYSYSGQQDFEAAWARIPVDFVNSLPSAFSEIEYLIRFQNQEQKYFRIGSETFKPEHAYVTDGDIFEVFDYQMTAGESASSLSEPNSMVLTQSMAQKYFGKSDPLGQTIHVLGDWTPKEVAFQVSGVIKDPPPNSHIPIDVLMSFTSEEERTGWAYVYIQIRKDADPQELESKFKSFVSQHLDAEEADKVRLLLQPYADIHLHSDLAREIIPNGSIQNVRAFSFIALFIALIALINYSNLSSTLLMTRTKEMGVRRILGAQSAQLTTALLITSIGTNLIAALTGILIVYWVFPYFSNLTGTQCLIYLPWAIYISLLFAMICGLIAGWYPASMMQTTKFKDKAREGLSFSLSSGKGHYIRRGLLTVQFTISILLVASAYLASRQFRFIQQKKLGLQKEQVLAIPSVPDYVTQNYVVLREELSKVSGVEAVAACMQVPSSEIRDVGSVQVFGRTISKDQAPMLDIQVMDQNLPDLMEFKWLAGNPKKWNEIRTSDITVESEGSTYDYLYRQSRGYVINRSALTTLGWKNPDEAIGQQINWSNEVFDLAYGPIIGVVADFHQETLRNKIDPIVMTYEPIWLRTFLVKVETDEVEETLSQINITWSEMFPSYALEYHFLDEMYEGLYVRESLQLKLLYLFSGLAVFIAFAGLFSLFAFSLRVRSREIAIRQILGADIWSLVKAFGRDYGVLFIIGATIAVPLSIYWTTNWLDNYAYHINITPIPFIYILLAIASSLFAIIMIQVILRSRKSPSIVLRDN